MKGKIYKLTNDLNEKIYIGSSTYQYLSERFNMHKQMCKDETGRRNSKLYTFMREIGIEHFKIELIEEYTCETKQQLVEHEQYWIEQLKPELNMFRAIANPNYEQECRDKEERRERSKAFYHSHKEVISQKGKEQITCECGCVVTKSCLSRHRKSLQHATLLANK
jgi:group I intron endonuclease